MDLSAGGLKFIDGIVYGEPRVHQLTVLREPRSEVKDTGPLKLDWPEDEPEPGQLSNEAGAFLIDTYVQNREAVYFTQPVIVQVSMALQHVLAPAWQCISDIQSFQRHLFALPLLPAPPPLLVQRRAAQDCVKSSHTWNCFLSTLGAKKTQY